MQQRPLGDGGEIVTRNLDRYSERQTQGMTTAHEYLEKRWTALILLCVAQFIVVLDASIVNVALPSIGKALNFSEENLPVGGAVPWS